MQGNTSPFNINSSIVKAEERNMLNPISLRINMYFSLLGHFQELHGNIFRLYILLFKNLKTKLSIKSKR